VPHYKIAPQKSFPPADNLPAKIRPARRPPGWVGFSPVNNCRPGETFLESDLIMGKFFYGPAIRGIHIESVIISLRADFSWGDILMWLRRLAACVRVPSALITASSSVFREKAADQRPNRPGYKAARLLLLGIAGRMLCPAVNYGITCPFRVLKIKCFSEFWTQN